MEYQNPFLLKKLREIAQVMSNATRSFVELEVIADSAAFHITQVIHNRSAEVRNVITKMKPVLTKYTPTVLGEGIAYSLIETESLKHKVHRFYGFKQEKQHDESWKRWVVLTKQETQRVFGAYKVPTKDLNDEEYQIAYRVWADMGFSPSENSIGVSFSPTGCMYRNALCARVSSGHLVLVQTGARDV